MSDSDFLQNYLLDLPWTVLGDALKYLPAELVYDPLSKVPALRNVIIESYFSNELHFILSPTLRPHLCTSDPQKRELIDITSYGEIEDFLVENPDVTPRLVKVITNQDFRSMELLLTKYRNFFMAVPTLQIHVEKYELTVEDMQLLLSFPNLQKLQTGRIKLHRALPAMISGFKHMKNLKEIVFLGHEIKNWSNLLLPPNLENFDVSWHPNTDVASMNLPDSVINLFWNLVGLTNSVFNSMTFSLQLRTLMLTYNNLVSINVSQLPQSLETIDLSHNHLSSFEYNEGAARWPPNLKTILLSNNAINDQSLRELSQIEWSPFLDNLRLDMNKFTRLDDLHTLPENLKFLDISGTLLSGFEVAHRQDDYIYFRFPEGLEFLNIQNSRALKYPQRTDTVEYRIKFPSSLATLNLDECNITDLSFFLFPLSLKTLSLSGNKIGSLNSYEFTVNGSGIVTWTQLKNLHELDLFFNSIENIECWMPPPSIRKIDLRKNAIKALLKVNTPLFNETFCHRLVDLHVLNLGENLIDTIDIDVVLPPNLTDLILRRNELTKFTFTPTFCCHSALAHLDISSNSIEEISIDLNVASASNLQTLNLSKNAGTLPVTSEQFYKMLEEIGLYVTKKKHNIKSEHTFK